MILNYTLIGITVSIFIALGVVFILFPKHVLHWTRTVFLPLLFRPVDCLNRLLGFKSDSYKPSEPTSRAIIIIRLEGSLSILMALLFLAAALGFFK